MAETLTHGVLVEVEGLGLLLRGNSGAGKSELAIELLSRGHKLIADDAVEWHVGDNNRLIGRCPALLSGFIEVRGLGILDARALYGDSAVIEQTALDLVIDLDRRDEPSAEERLGGRRGRFVLLGQTVPEISLPQRLGHNLAVLVEAACRDHKLRLAGYCADQVLVERQLRCLESNL